MESKDEKLTIEAVREPIEEKDFDDEVTSPCPELLTYQRSKTTPKIQLTEVSEQTEEVILEINEMGELENQDKVVYGMLPAGTEEQIVAQLKRQGSLKIDEPVIEDE